MVMKDNPITYRGKTYSSTKELATSFGVSTSFINTKLKTTKQSIDVIMEKAFKDAEQYIGDVYYWEKVLYEGRVYEDLEEFARKKKLSYTELTRLLDKKYTLDEAVKTVEDMKNVLKYRGRVFKTRKELAKHIGVAVPSLHEAFKQRDKVHTAVTLAKKIDKERLQKRDYIVYKDKKFVSPSAMLDYFNQLDVDARQDDEVDYIVTLLKNRHLSESILIVDNKVYLDIKHLASNYSIEVDVVQFRLDAGWSLERAVDYPCRLENIVLDGVRYSKLTNLARKYNLGVYALMKAYSTATSIKTVVENLNVNGLSVENVRSRKVVINGVKYKNYRELESSLGVPLGAIEGVVTDKLPAHLVVNCLTASRDSKKVDSVYFLADADLDKLTLDSVSNYTGISYEGVNYTTLSAFCSHFDLDKRIVACLLMRGYHPEEIILVCNEVVGGHASENR